MLRTRLLLALAGIISTSWFLLGFYWPNSTSTQFTLTDFLLGIGVLFSPILFLSALLMFVFSFLIVNETPDGRLEYDPSNPYWKILNKCFYLKGNVSLCKAYWLTTGLTLMSAITIFLVSILSWIFYQGDGGKFLASLSQMWPLLAFFGSFLLPLAPFHLGLSGSLAKKISIGIIVTVLISWFVVLPFYFFIFKNGLTMSESILKYLTAIGQFLLLMVCLYGGLGLLLFLAQYFSSRSPDSLLKRLFTTIKENMCPILYEHSTAGK